MATKKKETKSRYITRTLTLPNGKRKYVYGKTAAEADAKLAELKKDLSLDVNIDDDTTFGELAKIWLEEYKAPYLKDSSVYAFRTMLNAHVMPELAERKVRDINAHTIRAWFGKVVESGYSRSATLLSCVRSIFDVGVERGCIRKTPVPLTLRAPTAKAAKEKPVLPLKHEQLLLETLPLYTPERLFFMVGRYTGLRRGEIFALNWDCIDLEAGVLFVRRNLAVDETGIGYFANDTKTESGLREVPLPPVLHAELSSWKARFGDRSSAGLKTEVVFGTDGFLFCHNGGAPYSLQNLQTVWERIRKRIREVDEAFAKQFTPHVLRHTYITRLFEAGLDIKEVQYLAGHTDAQTTLGIYTHFDKQARRETTFAHVRDVMSHADKDAQKIKVVRL